MSTHLRLKSWLEAASMSQSELARRVEYDKSNMHRVLNGKLRPSLDLAFRIERETCGAVPAVAWSDAA